MELLFGPTPFEAHTALVLTSLIVCIFLIVVGRNLSFSKKKSDHFTAVQCSHRHVTPRLGGLAIFLAFELSFLFAPIVVSNNYGFFILATGIAFGVGFVEDLGFSISPRIRLLTVCIASIVVILLLGVWINRMGIPLMGSVTMHPAFGIPLTLLVTAGVANGFNLIDGVNGLAALTAMVAAAALGMIAYQGGYDVMVVLASMLAACVFGFFLLNYPFGLIFLGDAGAYTLGFVLSWFGIAILEHVSEASPWAILLTMFWPIADTVLAIYRRLNRAAPMMHPDHLHMHQIVMRSLEICVLGRRRRHFSNPLSTAVIAPFMMAPPIAGIIFWENAYLSLAAVLVFSGLFFGSYLLVPSGLRRYRRRLGTLATKPRHMNLRKIKDL
jgi:UDP-GlcNAc:undecaprenyl-phosphate GlcNAc-1-phosphate transferase